MKKNLMFVSAMAAALLLGACSGSNDSGTSDTSASESGTSQSGSTSESGSGTSSESGSDTSSESASESSSEASSSSTHESYVPENPDSAITIRVSAGETAASQAYLSVVGNEFSYYWHEKFPTAPEVLVEPVAISESSVKDEWLKDLTAAPDFSIAADDQIADLITAGGLEPLTTNIPQLDVDDIKTRNSASSVELCTYNDTLYAYPISASNGYFLYYDARKLTLDDVSTFDSLLAAIDRESNEAGVNYTFGFPTGSGWYLDGWWRAAGYDLARKTNGTDTECDWNSTTKTPTGVEVAGAMLKLSNGEHNGHWLGRGDTTLMTMVSDGTTDQVIATINGTWSADAIKEAWGEDGAAATILPKYTIDGVQYQMESVAGCKVGIVNAMTGKAAYAAHFGDFLTSTANQVYRYNALAEAPTNIEASAAVDLTANYAVGALAQQLAVGGFVQQVGTGFWSASESLSNFLTTGMNGETALVTDAGTANVAINETALQSLLNDTVAGITGELQS